MAKAPGTDHAPTTHCGRGACVCVCVVHNSYTVLKYEPGKETERWLWAQGDPSVFEEYLFIYQLMYLFYLVLLHHLENKES